MWSKYPPSARIAYLLLSIILFFHTIIWAKDFLYPIVLGILFAYLLYPVAEFLERYHLPRILSILLSILLLGLILGTVFLFLGRKILFFADDLPLFKQKALLNIEFLEHALENEYGFRDLKITEFLRNTVKEMFERGSSFLNKAFQSTAGTLFRIALLPVYIFLFLYYRTKFALFFIKLIPAHRKFEAVSVLREVSRVTTRYMGGLFTVVAIVCLFNTIGLLILGIKYPYMLGIISGLFAFIPYFGVLIGGAITFLFVLLTAASPLVAIHVVIMYLIVNFLENNFLTPLIVGSHVKLNPFIIIVGIIGAGMVWGIPGMFAIVPLLAMVRIACKHIEVLKPYGYLMGTTGTRRHALNKENISAFAGKISRLFRRIKSKS